MDTKSQVEITHLSLFSGIGGLDLAAEWAGIKTVGQCEWADYPTKVLEKHWPCIPRWRDIRTLTQESFYEKTGRRTIDIISGGFPCQPFSTAGKRRGKEDDRYLWPEMVRIIKELRPTWIVGENVAGIVRMALPDILSELETCGYRTRAFLIPACAVGARHRRYRVAIVGYRANNMENPDSFGCGEQKDVREQQRRTKCDKGDVPNSNGTRLQTKRSWEQTARTTRKDCHVPNTDSGGQSVRRDREFSADEEIGRERCDFGGGAEEHEPGQRRPIEPGLGGMADGLSDWVDGYWDIEPDIPRIAQGIPHRIDRLKGLGNAVVPQQFYPIFKAIAEIIWEEFNVKKHPAG